MWVVQYFYSLGSVLNCGIREKADDLMSKTAHNYTWYMNDMDIRMFHRTTFCRGDNYTGKNFVPPIKTRSPVVKAVKMMAWRQAKSPLKITTWSCVQRLASQISQQTTNWDIHKWFCQPPSYQFDYNSTTVDLVFMGGTKFYPIYAESSQWNTLTSTMNIVLFSQILCSFPLNLLKINLWKCILYIGLSHS